MREIVNEERRCSIWIMISRCACKEECSDDGCEHEEQRMENGGEFVTSLQVSSSVKMNIFTIERGREGQDTKQ